MILPRRRLATSLGVLAVLAAGAPTQGETRAVTTRFIGDTVYLSLVTHSGDTLELYTDTGGGGLILSKAAARRQGLLVGPANDPQIIAALGPKAETAIPPRIDSNLPPLPAPALIMPRAAELPDWPEQGDGILGAPWFAGHVWTWNYPDRSLTLQSATWRPPVGAASAPLGFKVDTDGRETTHFARLAARIDGHVVQMLLDTGAETYLSPAALKALNDGGPALRATSMISASIFDAWRRAHPEWRVIPSAQANTKADMILVPDVLIAELNAGPVWFTKRPDAAYRQFMSSMTDRPVVGSLGGNAFHRFVMTLDYPGRQAVFIRP